MGILYAHKSEVEEGFKVFKRHIDMAFSTDEASAYKLILQYMNEINEALIPVEGVSQITYNHRSSEYTALGLKFYMLASKGANVYENLLLNLDLSCYSVLYEWERQANDINHGKNEITMKGTIKLQANSYNKTNPDLSKKKIYGDVNIIDFVSNDLNGYNDAFSDFKHFETERLKKIYAYEGVVFTELDRLQHEHNLFFPKVHQVNALQTEDEKELEKLKNIAMFVIARIAGGIPGNIILGGIAAGMTFAGGSTIGDYLLGSNGNTLGGSPISKENFVDDFVINTTIGGISGAAGGTASSIIKKINLGKIPEELGGEAASQFVERGLSNKKKDSMKNHYTPEKINIPKGNASEVTVKKEKVEGGIKVIIE